MTHRKNIFSLNLNETEKIYSTIAKSSFSRIPIWKDDPNNIFIAYALCEGEIGGLYDLYIDGNPLDARPLSSNLNVVKFPLGKFV